MSHRGSIVVEGRTNSIIITDLEDNVAKIEKMAQALDSTTPQIEITAKLVDVDAEALRGMGIEWNIAPATPEFWSGVDDPLNPGKKILPGGGPIHNNDYTTNLAGDHNTSISDPATRL